MLHLYPGLVRMERARDFELSPEAFRRYVRDELPSPPPGGAGVVGRPTLASADKGAAIYERMLNAIQRAVFRPATDTDSDTL
jgi:creatinine amidohydrolase/Fe(II)-dependent formamide hydrolase-like protein